MAPIEEQRNKENGPGSNGRRDEVSLNKHRARMQEPDVIVAVGEREFSHYRQVLCLASDYFDAALNSGMKETETMRIEFPDDDPSEWELFASFLEPFSQAKITKSNVVALIPWFHKFGITSMLKRCDRIYVEMVSPPLAHRCRNKVDAHLPLPNEECLRNKLHDLLNAYDFSTLYNLTITRERATRALRRQITCSPHTFDLESTASLVVVLEQEENRKDLWGSVKEYIPAELQSEDPQSLVSNKLFPHLLLTWMQSHEPPQDGMYHA